MGRDGCPAPLRVDYSVVRERHRRDRCEFGNSDSNGDRRSQSSLSCPWTIPEWFC
jgi:hypothetical protein